MMIHIIALIATDEYPTDGRNENTKEKAQDLIKGYAEQMKIKYHKEYLESRHYSEADAQRISEEIKQSVLKNPMDYFQMPFI